MAQRKLPIGIQNFEKIRKENYVYVDKTQYIERLVSNGSVYFLSRPRRFGKSLLISTLEAYFRGEKDLFQGLAMERYENKKGEDAWQKYPVIRFSLADGDFQTEKGLKDKFNDVIEGAVIEYNLTGNIRGETLPVRFKNLIEQLHMQHGKQVVVLVDEYDKPLLDTMELNPEQEERNRLFYKGFFGVLKSQDQHLKFVLFTGVTRFSKISIFSDLNQLNDISMDDRYAGICGITEEELLCNFPHEIKALAEENEQTESECLNELSRMYDGYHFSKKGSGVYNPFSILNAFDKKDYGSYWFSTGTPSFLIRKLIKSGFTAEQLSDGVESKEAEIIDYTAENPNPIPLLYQSGYLTIGGYTKRFRTYTLRFPNEEVKYGLLNSLVPVLLGNHDAQSMTAPDKMIVSLEKGDSDSFMTILKSLFAGIPYIEGKSHIYEQEWRNEIYLILALLGQNVKCEVHTARGRADCVVETRDCVYIFEFKLDRTADEALQQIEENGYTDPYEADERKVILIGVNFSSEKRNVESWKVIFHEKNDRKAVF